MLVAQDTQDRPRCAGRVGILVVRGIREETLGCCRELLTYRSCSDVRAESGRKHQFGQSTKEGRSEDYSENLFP